MGGLNVSTQNFEKKGLKLTKVTKLKKQLDKCKLYYIYKEVKRFAGKFSTGPTRYW